MEDIYWHDGVFQGIQIEGSGDILISCDLYRSDDSKVRDGYIFKCSNPTSITSAIDFVALKDNKKSGNINNGRISCPRRGSVNLKLFLTDGYVEVTAKKLHIQTS